MKRLPATALFAAAALSAVGWLLLTPVFTAPTSTGAIVVLVAAALLAGAACVGCFRPPRIDRRYLLVVPALALAVWLMPWPGSLGIVVLGVAILLLWAARVTPRVKSAAVGLLLLGTVLTVQGLLLGPGLRLMSFGHTVRHLSGPLAWGLRAIGVDAAADTDSVTLLTIYAPRRFPVSPELLGFPAAALMLVAALIVIPTTFRPGTRLRAAIVVVVAWLAYIPLRVFALLTVFVQLQLYVGYFSDAVRVDVFWDPWWQLASLAPLALVWGLVAGRPGVAAERGEVLAPYRSLWHSVGLGAAALGAALAVFAMTYHEVGKPAAKRILIDEVHSNWEQTTRTQTLWPETETHTFGTNWYGTASMYNMFSLADYLAYSYDVTRWTKGGALDDARLAEVDVLVLKTPTLPYSDDEVAAIARFVERGGGLLMIGEHTNWVGSATTLNKVAGHFGMRFREDALFNLIGESPYEQVWHRPADRFHPVVASVPQYRFEVSCSVRTEPLAADAVMISRGLYQREADYHMSNYYPFPSKISDVRFGPFTQFAAGDFGRGRVAAFTDSTTLSNFSAFHPGRVELILGTIDWLGRTHTRGLWRWFVGIPGVLIAVFGATLVWKLSPRLGAAALLAAAVVFGVVLASALVRTAVRRDFVPPTPHTPPVHVAFLREHCDYELPIEHFIRDRDQSYDMFFQWVLRLRCFPRVRERLADALDDDLIVIVNPCEPFAPNEVALLRGYLESGGKVVVLLRTSPSARPPRTLFEPLHDAQARMTWRMNLAAARDLLASFGVEVPGGDVSLVDAINGARVAAAVPTLPVAVMLPPSAPGAVFVALRVECAPRYPLEGADGSPTGVLCDGLRVDGGRTLFGMHGAPAGASVNVGAGRLVVLGFGAVFRDNGMGGTNATDPNDQLTARYRVQFRLLQELLPPDAVLPKRVAEEVKADVAGWQPLSGR